jgi:hypothetical protein
MSEEQLIVKVKSVPHRKGQSINTRVGKIVFNDEAIAEVTKEQADWLTNAGIGITHHLEKSLKIPVPTTIGETKKSEESCICPHCGKNIKEFFTDKEPEGEKEVGTQDHKGEDGDEEKPAKTDDQEIAVTLARKTVVQLKELAKEFKFPEAEWNKLEKAKLIEYLIAKTKEQQ